MTAIASLLLASCGTGEGAPPLEGEPSARGILYSEGNADPAGPGATVTFTLLVDEDEYPYFEDARLTFDSRTIVTTQTGETLGLGDLESGMVVDVWTDACQESFPVQCGVTHVRVTRVD